jgi:hypothetical protein
MSKNDKLPNNSLPSRKHLVILITFILFAPCSLIYFNTWQECTFVDHSHRNHTYSSYSMTSACLKAKYMCSNYFSKDDCKMKVKEPKV